MQMLNRQLVEDQIIQAKNRKNKLDDERRARAEHNLVKWDEHRVRKAALTEIYTQYKQ